MAGVRFNGHGVFVFLCLLSFFFCCNDMCAFGRLLALFFGPDWCSALVWVVFHRCKKGLWR